jgi:hypothetical protein
MAQQAAQAAAALTDPRKKADFRKAIDLVLAQSG